MSGLAELIGESNLRVGVLWLCCESLFVARNCGCMVFASPAISPSLVRDAASFGWYCTASLYCSVASALSAGSVEGAATPQVRSEPPEVQGQSSEPHASSQWLPCCRVRGLNVGHRLMHLRRLRSMSERSSTASSARSEKTLQAAKSTSGSAGNSFFNCVATAAAEGRSFSAVSISTISGPPVGEPWRP